MKKIFFSFIFIFIIFIVNSQTKNLIDTNQKYNPRYTLNTGVFYSVSSFGNQFGTYIAPNVQFANNSKFSFGGGAIISNTSFSNYKNFNYSENKFNTANTNITQSTLYFNGTYKPTNRLTINALAYKSFNLNESNKVQQYINAFNNNTQGLFMNIDYKITENSRINFGFNYSNGNNNQYSNPFNNRNNFNMNLHNNQNSLFNW